MMTEKNKRMREKFMQKISIRMLRIRELLGMSRKEFGKHLGLSGSSISYIENGKYLPCITIIQKLIEIFHVNPYYIFTGNGPILQVRPKKRKKENGDHHFYEGVLFCLQILNQNVDQPVSLHKVYGEIMKAVDEKELIRFVCKKNAIKISGLSQKKRGGCQLLLL